MKLLTKLILLLCPFCLSAQISQLSNTVPVGINGSVIELSISQPVQFQFCASVKECSNPFKPFKIPFLVQGQTLYAIKGTLPYKVYFLPFGATAPTIIIVDKIESK